MMPDRCHSCDEPAPVLVYCATCIRRCCEACLFGEDLYCLPCWRTPPPAPYRRKRGGVMSALIDFATVLAIFAGAYVSWLVLP